MKHVENMTHLCYPLLPMILLDPTCSYHDAMYVIACSYCSRFTANMFRMLIYVNMAMSSPPVPVRELQHLCDQHTSMQLPAPFYGSDLCICGEHAECWRNFIVLPSYPILPHHTSSLPSATCQILSLLCSSSSFSTVQGWSMPWNGYDMILSSFYI
jgi:hypothetical protein